MKTIAFTFILLCTLPLRAMAQPAASSWTQVDPRTVQTAAEGRGPDGPFKSRLEIMCTTGQGGTLTLTYTVMNSKGLPSFHFDPFEGPDAPAALKKWTTVEVISSSGNEKRDVYVSGYFSTGKDFSFGLSALNRSPGDPHRIVRRIAEGAERLTWEVRDSQNPRLVLRSEFPLAGAQALVKSTAAGCLRSASK